MRIFAKNYNYLLFFLGFLTICLPLIAVGIYNHPSNADYWELGILREQGYWGAQSWFYEHVMGRFFTVWLLFSYFHFLGFLGFKIIAPILIATLFATMYAFFRTVIPRGISNSKIFIATSCFMILYLGYMPSITEGVFWISGALMYQATAIVALLFIVSFYKEKRTNTKFSKRVMQAFAIFFLILTIGSNEIFTLYSIIFIGIVNIYYYCKEKTIRWFYGMLLLVAVITSMVVVLAPGNMERPTLTASELEYTLTNLPLTISQSFLYTLEELFSWVFSPPLLLLTFLLTPLFLEIRKHIRFFPKILSKPHITALFTIGMLYISHAIAIWNSGTSPLRLQNILFLFFLVLWFFVSLQTILILTERQAAMMDGISKSLQQKSFGIALCIITILISFRSSHAIVALKDLTSNIAYKYNQELLSRYAILKASQKNQIIPVEPIHNYPSSIFLEDIIYDEKNLANKQYADFFEVMGIRVKAPTDQSPLPFVWKEITF